MRRPSPGILSEAVDVDGTSAHPNRTIVATASAKCLRYKLNIWAFSHVEVKEWTTVAPVPGLPLGVSRKPILAEGRGMQSKVVVTGSRDRETIPLPCPIRRTQAPRMPFGALRLFCATLFCTVKMGKPPCGYSNKLRDVVDTTRGKFDRNYHWPTGRGGSANPWPEPVSIGCKGRDLGGDDQSCHCGQARTVGGVGRADRRHHWGSGGLAINW